MVQSIAEEAGKNCNHNKNDTNFFSKFYILHIFIFDPYGFLIQYLAEVSIHFTYLFDLFYFYLPRCLAFFNRK